MAFLFAAMISSSPGFCKVKQGTYLGASLSFIISLLGELITQANACIVLNNDTELVLRKARDEGGLQFEEHLKERYELFVRFKLNEDNLLRLPLFSLLLLSPTLLVDLVMVKTTFVDDMKLVSVLCILDLGHLRGPLLWVCTIPVGEGRLSGNLAVVYQAFSLPINALPSHCALEAAVKGPAILWCWGRGLELGSGRPYRVSW
jgi:hypothetical protein